MGFDSRSKAAALLDVLHVRLWLSLGCLLFSLSIVSAADVVKQLDVSYGEEIRKLDICIPSSPPLGSILIIHGGGWVAGDKRDDIGLCTLFAKSGILALSVNYTLLDGTTNRWPAPIDDVKAVQSWLLTHAREYSVEGKAVCLMGDSAGAHLAAIVALTTDGIACSVLNFAPMLFDRPEFTGTIRHFFPGSSPSQFRELARSVSPPSMVTGRAGPMMIAQGYEDTTVPPVHSQALINALVSSRVPFSALFFQGGHEWQGLKPSEIADNINMEIEFVTSKLRPLAPPQ
jgi:acetyl esterase/lipase